MEHEDAGGQIESQLLSGLGMLKAAMGEAMRPPRFEYRIVSWHEVNALAADGWQMVPVSPLPGWFDANVVHADYRNEVLGFVMMHQLSASDDAEQLLKDAAGQRTPPRSV